MTPTAVSKTKAATTNAKHSSDGGAPAAMTVVLVKPSITKGSAGSSKIYDEALKEISTLADNDGQAKKVDGGPLKEARGKDTWQLHAQLRAVDQLNASLEKHAAALTTALSTLDDHLHSNVSATADLINRQSAAATQLAESNASAASQAASRHSQGTNQLVESHGSTIAGKLASNKEAIQGWITSTRTELNKAVTSAEASISDAVSKAQTALKAQSKESHTDVAQRLDALLKTVHDSFNKLSKATAGTEENLRTQTDSFSKAVESLLVNVQNDLNKKIVEFRDESTRQIDRRFNQSDVAFAAVRADQEVIKALLTDIIKDRLGRSEPRSR